MIERVKEFLRKYELQDKTIIVGFSGGFDSMCLLDILSKIRQYDEFEEMKVVAAHFNHNWRGDESLQEQEVCRIFASAKGFDFYSKIADKKIKKTENDARVARYEFFEEAYEEYDADAVFTAHNKDDNAETVLYRIIKGTGIIGLKGIAEKRKYFYRPLLTTFRSEIVNYCIENNLSPNQDSSNNNIIYKRNYLRLNVIPALERINENIKEALNVLSKVANSDDEIIEEYLSTIRPHVFDGEKINSQVYKNLSLPVQKRFLHEYIQNLGLDYDYKKVIEIHDFIAKNIEHRNGTTISLASAMWLYADDKKIEPIPSKVKGETPETINYTIDSCGEFQIGSKRLIISKYVENDLFVFPESTSNFAYVDLSQVEFPLKLRTRKDGDIISPLGMSGTMKLKKYLNAKGVTRHNRDKIPLLSNDKEILWVVGVGLSNKIGVKEKPTHVIKLV